jgi:hypothetical protein
MMASAKNKKAREADERKAVMRSLERTKKELKALVAEFENLDPATRSRCAGGFPAYSSKDPAQGPRNAQQKGPNAQQDCVSPSGSTVGKFSCAWDMLN